MNLINRIKQFAETAVDAGKARASHLRDRKKRSELVAELGELTLRKHQGDPIDDAAVDAILTELDRLDATDEGDADDGPSSADDEDSAAVAG